MIFWLVLKLEISYRVIIISWSWHIRSKIYKIISTKSHSLWTFHQYQEHTLISLELLVMILSNAQWKNNSILNNSCTVGLNIVKPVQFSAPPTAWELFNGTKSSTRDTGVWEISMWQTNKTKQSWQISDDHSWDTFYVVLETGIQMLNTSLTQWQAASEKQRVHHTMALPFTLKSIARQKKNYGNWNISPCKNIIFKKSSKRNQNLSRYYNSN